MPIRKILLLIFAALMAHAAATAATTGATQWSATQCLGSALPYPDDVAIATYPDSLTPVFINHVGRHGARFLSSARPVKELSAALRRADSLGTITPAGRQLAAIIATVNRTTAGQWGALDSLGMAEQRGIASRMFRTYPQLFDRGRVEAISSYAPRCIMSMYSFAHQLSRLNNNLEVTTSSGRQWSSLMRPFDVDPEYREYREADDTWSRVYDPFEASTVTLEPLRRVLGDISDYSPEEARALAMYEYQLIAGLPAMGMRVDLSAFFTVEELNRLWAVKNLKQYLLYSSSTLSTIPADMASPLLVNIIETTDSAAMGVRGMPTVMLRFGHAETLMPLMALLRLKGAYYMTNYFETVGTHWKDFDIVPMAANLQFVLFKSKRGRYYLRLEINETPTPLMPGSTDIYLPWERAREYMNRCIPIFYLP